MIRKQLNKKAASVLTAAVLSIGTMFTPTPSESSPCSCWSAGTVGCQKWQVGGCSHCWAGWDTGVFTPKFDMKEYQKIKDQVDKFYGGIMSKENFDKAKKALDAAAGAPVSMVWEPAMMAGAFIGAGIDAMENCRKACQSAKAKHGLNEPVWWYADETALNSCKDYAKKFNKPMINKYQYNLR